MNLSSKWIAAVLVLAGLILVNFIGSLIPGQADFTENKLYTLSDGSRSLLDKLEEPVKVKFFFNRSAESLPTYIKNYATLVEGLLRQYERASGGMLTVEVIDPKPDSEEVEEATRAGIQRNRIFSGEELFCGIQVIQAAEEEKIPFLDWNREQFLEYDISQLIYQVQLLDKPTLGLISGLQVTGGGMPPGMLPPGQRPPQDWFFIQSLRRNFEIQEVSGDTIPGDLDVLLVIFPQNLSEQLLYAIDQYVLAGKPALVAVDPSSFNQRSQMNPQDMFRQGNSITTSANLRLLDKWGVKFDGTKILGDLENPTPVGRPGGGPATNFPLWVSLRDEAKGDDRASTPFNKETPATAQLNSMLLPEPGAISLKEGSGLTLTPLVTTSEKSGFVSSTELTFFADPEQLAGKIESDGRSYTVAGIVSGKFKTAFPNGKPAQETDEDEEEEEEEPEESEPGLAESTGTSTVVVVADTDYLTDSASVEIMNLFGNRIASPRNDNLAFTLNLVEFLAGSQDLISLRSKGTSSREFTLVKKLQVDAQKKFQDRLKELDEKLQEARAKIRELSSEQEQKGALVLTPEMVEVREKFQKQEADILKEQRLIRKELREDIERLEVRLGAFNLLVVPKLLILFGIAFFIMRSRRQRS